MIFMRNGIIDSVAVSALNYATSEVNTFFQTRGGVLPWTRSERLSHEVVLAADQALPKTIRFLLRGLGPKDEGADLLSYLLFEPAYSRRLVELGYKDAMVRSGEIGNFMAN